MKYVLRKSTWLMDILEYFYAFGESDVLKGSMQNLATSELSPSCIICYSYKLSIPFSLGYRD
jgi:hypothetical protein